MSKYKNKVLVYRLLYCLAGFTMGGTIGYVEDYKENKIETVASIPETVAKYINNTEQKIKEDSSITYQRLSKLIKITINAAEVDNYDFLEKFPNAVDLVIFNAEYLTDNDIDAINNSQVGRVHLNFQLDNVYSIKENKFDLSRFYEQIILTNSENDMQSEIYNIIFFNYLLNYNEEMFLYKDYYNKYSSLNKKLDEMIDNYEINKYDSYYEIESDARKYNLIPIDNNAEKIYKIAKCICDKIVYDEEVKTDLQDNKMDETTEKNNNYNKYCISKILDNDSKEVEGVSINYASLFDILCYKSGINSKIISGIADQIEYYWNEVDNNEKFDFIDLTKFDNEKAYEILKVNDKSYKLFPYIHAGRERYEKKYIINEPYSIPAKEEINYINDKIEGKKIKNDCPTHKIYILLYGLLNLLCVNEVYNLAIHKKEYELELKHNK